jgi:hypothetical protein
MKTDFEVGEIVFLPDYSSLFYYAGRDENKRFAFKLLISFDKKAKMTTNHIAFPEKHLTDPSYDIDLMRIRQLLKEDDFNETARIFIRRMFNR